MTRYFTAAQLLEMRLPVVPADKGALSRLIEREGWKSSPLARQVDGLWEYNSALLPIEAQMEVLVREAAQAESVRSSSAAWDTFERLAPGLKEQAQLRLSIVTLVMDLTASGSIKGAAVALASRQHGVSSSTIWTWLKLIDGVPRPDWLPALAPGHRGRTVTADCDARAWDFFVADFLRSERPSLSACYRRLQEAAAIHRWSPIPASKTLQRRLDREIPAAAQTLARYGREAAARAFPAQRRDRSGFRAMEAVNADGHRFDVFVRWEDGRVGRAVATVVQDLGTGLILGHRVAETENWSAVRLAFADVVNTYGIPEHCYLDNGRAFASKWLTGGMKNRFRFKVRDDEPQGILTQLGVKVHWTTPYHGQAKPIERAFRDLAEEIAKHPMCAGAYTGNSPTTKPDNYNSKAVPIAEFRELVAAEIERHNARKGRRGMGLSGLSFVEAFKKSLDDGAIVLKASAAQRRMLLMAAEGVMARRDSGEIHMADNRYWAPELADHAGEQLVVRFDPDNLHAPIGVFTKDGRLICEAPAIENAGFADSEAAQAHTRKRRTYLKAARDLLDAEQRLDIGEVAALMATFPASAAARPEAPVVRLMPDATIPSIDPAAADAALARATRAMAGELDEADVIPFRRAEG